MLRCAREPQITSQSTEVYPAGEYFVAQHINARFRRSSAALRNRNGPGTGNVHVRTVPSCKMSAQFPSRNDFIQGRSSNSLDEQRPRHARQEEGLPSVSGRTKTRRPLSWYLSSMNDYTTITSYQRLHILDPRSHDIRSVLSIISMWMSSARRLQRDSIRASRDDMTTKVYHGEVQFVVLDVSVCLSSSIHVCIVYSIL